MKEHGLRLESNAFALDLPHSTCDVLTRTGSVDNALRHIKNATGRTSAKDIRNFGSLSVEGYCPTSMPKT